MKTCPNFKYYAHDGDFIPLCGVQKKKTFYKQPQSFWNGMSSPALYKECYFNYEEYESCPIFSKVKYGKTMCRMRQ